MADTGDPFDTGARLPANGMLDLGQSFTHSRWYAEAPKEYADAIRKNQKNFAHPVP